MPRFAANLRMLFTECHSPNVSRRPRAPGSPPSSSSSLTSSPHDDIARWLSDNGLVNVLFNLPPGDWANGERGCASIPGREAEFFAGLDRALEYAGRPRHAAPARHGRTPAARR